MSRPRRILTACLGNHCRSTFAALVLADRGGPAVELRSAGLVAGRRSSWASGYSPRASTLLIYFSTRLVKSMSSVARPWR
ncbi:hypothetical protein [Kutzneria buriramensis]|uniref:Phosphotyrosine protein phosphatase I domain-containing protein n=1 Tax=Kutzneria buriramensis TaxID=1045776 RepID=A0A3E0HLL3_9PSEU|nr:hypothetical protein [Kutzneria buriramensis]REH47363.1 hypothetical protein BCF44_106528 [Kutzneria buriramensis]